MVHRLDRLAGNLDDLRKIVKAPTAKGVNMQFVKENLIFTGDDSPLTNLMLNIIDSFAEFARSLMDERQREGVQIAKANGRV